MNDSIMDRLSVIAPENPQNIRVRMDFSDTDRTLVIEVEYPFDEGAVGISALEQSATDESLDEIEKTGLDENGHTELAVSFVPTEDSLDDPTEAVIGITFDTRDIRRYTLSLSVFLKLVQENVPQTMLTSHLVETGDQSVEALLLEED